MDRETNIVGALSLVLSDEIKKAVNEVVGASGETAAAIIMLGPNGGLSAGEVAQALAITPSGVARLIDRLANDGLVVRRSGLDQRVVVLELTIEGQRLRSLALAARERVIKRCLHGISEYELKNASPILERMIKNLLVDQKYCYRFCRMCDEGACDPDCPVEEHKKSFVADD
ncbi:MarR family winged helix-turn-helix transcriptional regulator [Aureimonas pseudogalii]|uniref:DNA-binding MarR family transcriptional regulator n=1 Tax=Aureimonas pseudogalii TaxID=1744844 RepID=A0A7W6H821_9HYPH|nr:MarR family transcriptional regulator [Aureimonas pseudogalii]MBB4000252.1 DNA-binding MarR family transcriptional regulator [Aureimonas pseudogalii]